MNSPDIVAPSQERNVPATKEVKPIDTVRNLLENMKPQLQMVLPKHISVDKLCRVALTAVQQNPKLLDCDKKSLLGAVMRSAQLGLEPDGLLGQAYLIPFKGTVQFIVGYKGLIDLARRSGEVSNILAKEVYENDVFDVDFSKDIPFVHKPKLNGERGEVTHFWALAKFKDGGFHWDYMTVGEVIEVRDKSSGWQSAKQYGKTASSPWSSHFNEMAKKTIIRRIAKYLPMSVQKAAITEDLADAGKPYAFDQSGEIFVMDDDKPTIDGMATDTTDQAAIPNQVTPEVTQPAPAKKPATPRARKGSAPATTEDEQQPQPAAAQPTPAPAAVPAAAAAPRPYVAPQQPQPQPVQQSDVPAAGNFEEFGE